MAKRRGFWDRFHVLRDDLNGCLVLIPDSNESHSLKQQYQRQREQISEIKLRMRELIGDYKSGWGQGVSRS
nr:hypothetical protein [Providencia rettgeri]